MPAVASAVEMSGMFRRGQVSSMAIWGNRQFTPGLKRGAAAAVGTPVSAVYHPAPVQASWQVDDTSDEKLFPIKSITSSFKYLNCRLRYRRGHQRFTASTTCNFPFAQRSICATGRRETWREPRVTDRAGAPRGAEKAECGAGGVLPKSAAVLATVSGERDAHVRPLRPDSHWT